MYSLIRWSRKELRPRFPEVQDGKEEWNLCDVALSEIELEGLGTPTTIAVNVAFNRITRLSWLRYFQQLVRLNISHNLLTNLLGLEHLQSLQNLDCSANQISELNPLIEIKSLVTLRANSNCITAVHTELWNLSALEILEVIENPIEDRECDLQDKINKSASGAKLFITVDGMPKCLFGSKGQERLSILEDQANIAEVKDQYSSEPSSNKGWRSSTQFPENNGSEFGRTQQSTIEEKVIEERGRPDVFLPENPKQKDSGFQLDLVETNLSVSKGHEFVEDIDPNSIKNAIDVLKRAKLLMGKRDSINFETAAEMQDLSISQEATLGDTSDDMIYTEATHSKYTPSNPNQDSSFRGEIDQDTELESTMAIRKERPSSPPVSENSLSNIVVQKLIHESTKREAVVIRGDGSCLARWPNGNIAVSVDYVSNDRFRCLVMSEKGTVLASFDDKGSGALNYENGRTFVSVASSGHGLIMNKHGRVEEVFNLMTENEEKSWSMEIGKMLAFRVDTKKLRADIEGSKAGRNNNDQECEEELANGCVQGVKIHLTVYFKVPGLHCRFKNDFNSPEWCSMVDAPKTHAFLPSIATSTTAIESPKSGGRDERSVEEQHSKGRRHVVSSSGVDIWGRKLVSSLKARRPQKPLPSISSITSGLDNIEILNHHRSRRVVNIRRSGS